MGKTRSVAPLAARPPVLGKKTNSKKAKREAKSRSFVLQLAANQAVSASGPVAASKKVAALARAAGKTGNKTVAAILSEFPRHVFDSAAIGGGKKGKKNPNNSGAKQGSRDPMTKTKNRAAAIAAIVSQSAAIQADQGYQANPAAVLSSHLAMTLPPMNFGSQKNGSKSKKGGKKNKKKGSGNGMDLD